MKHLSLEAFNWKVNKKQYLCSFVAKNNSYTLDLEKFWAAGLLDGCKTFRYLISCVRCSIFQISIAPMSSNDMTAVQLKWQTWWPLQVESFDGRLLIETMTTHMSELAQRQGWWHLSDWMRLLWNWRKWLTSFTFKLGWHWLWSEVAILMMLYGKLTFQNIWTT